MKHATVQLGEYRVPLIGIAESEVLETCDCCHDLFSLQQIELTGLQFLCPRCRASWIHRDTPRDTPDLANQPPQASINRAGKP